MTSPSLPRQTLLLEASWEVCNKYGGIHTVVTSKLPQALSNFPDRYLAVGPLFAENSAHHEEPLPDWLQPAVAALTSQGVTVRYGRWITETEPPTILIGTDGLVPRLSEFKKQFWDTYQLDSLHTDFNDFDKPLLWSIGVGLFVRELAKTHPDPIIYHGHEWLSGAAILVLKEDPPANVRTVFTTHATFLGRVLSSTGTDLYPQLPHINPDKAMHEHGVASKCQLERICARLATIFTTVSSLTAREAQVFMDRKPDILTENGLDRELFPAFDEICQKQPASRALLDDFIAAYFFPSYRFDLATTSYQFTMGRYEAHNKGYDLYLTALGKLNEQLKQEHSPQTVVAWFLVPGDPSGLRPEVSTQLTAHARIKEILKEVIPTQQRQLYQSVWEENFSAESPFSSSLTRKLSQLRYKFPRYEAPPISPYNLQKPGEDAILSGAEKNGLLNREEDRVKVLFFPVYLEGFDGIFNRHLYEIIAGCDLGVFPSYYEPWGYTPMESLAMGVPTITSDLAGFGQAILAQKPEGSSATTILKREGIPDDVAADELRTVLYKHLGTSPRNQLAQRIDAYRLIQSFDWSSLYERYLSAYHSALSKPA